MGTKNLSNQLKSLKEFERYEVLWHDAYAHMGWREAAYWQSDTACECETLGYYIGTNKAGDLLFAATRDTKNGSFNNIQGRPKAMIRSIRRLK